MEAHGGSWSSVELRGGLHGVPDNVGRRQRWFTFALHDDNVLKKNFLVCLTNVWMFESLEASGHKLEIHGSQVHTRNGERLV